MSGSRKALKVLSIIMIVFSAIGIVMGLLLTTTLGLIGDTSNLAGTDLTVAAGSAVVATLGIVLVITSIVYLVIAIFGLRGAKNPQKIGVFFVLSIIGAVFGAIGLIMNIVQGAEMTTILSSVVSLVIVCVFVWLANNIKKEAALQA